MEDLQISKKHILLAALAALFLVGVFAGGFYGVRRVLLKLPSFAQSQLAAKGISLTYKDEGHSRTGSSVDVYDVTLTGKPLPYEVKLKGIGVDVKFGYSPLARINLRINKPIVSKNPLYVAVDSAKAEPTSSRLLVLVGAVMKLMYVSMEIVDASMPEYGLSDLSATAILNTVKFSSHGLESISFAHEMNLSSLANVPWFPGVCWIGTTVLANNKLEMKDHTLGLGVFATKLTAYYDLTSQKWSADVSIPDGPIKNKEQIASSSNAFWLTSASGEIGLKASFQGIGSDTAGIQAEGNAHAKELVLGMNHNYVRGNLKSDFDITFKKTTALELNAKIFTDLTNALVVNKDEFRKTKDIPFSIQTELEGKDGTIQIRSAEILFNNLKSTISGSWSYLPQKSANLQFEIAPVNLAGWQQFFPRYPAMLAQGNLSMAGSYTGSTEDWKTATIDLRINAQKLKFPILRIWNTSKDFQIEGVTRLESETSLSMVAGSLKNLSTVSFIDLKDTKIKYTNLFNKEEGSPLDFDLVINSTKNQAEIKKGVVHLGRLGASAKGKITNFESPIANMLLQTDFMEVPDLLAFLPPAFKLKTIEKARGAVAIKAKINGPLLSKEGPEYSAEVETRKLGLNYIPEDKKGKKIEILNITGPLVLSPDMLQTKKLFVQTPGSDGFLDMSVKNFAEPDIQFSFQGNKFTLKDFYVQEKPKPVEAAAAAATTANAEDFRKNPFLQKLRLSGDASVKFADLGYTQTENLNIKLKYDRLKLSVFPLSFNAFGGFISSDTDWDGTQEKPVTRQNLKVVGVDANRFLASYSDKAKDILLGKLSTSFTLTFSGMKADEIQKTMKGGGNFSLADGTLKTLKFTKEPMQTLKKVPLIGNQITKTDWDERFNDINGAFTIEDGKLLITNILFNSPYFEGSSKNATVGFDQSLTAVVTLIPKESMLPATIADIIRDEAGKPSLPITLSGQLQSPTVGLDSSILIPRTKNYLARQAEKEKERAVSNIKTKATEEAKKVLNGGFGKFLK